MASKEDIYVSIVPENYRASKSNVLGGQADLLNIMKHQHNLKVLARRKNELKIKLHKLLEGVSKNVDSLQDKIPTSKLPKAMKHEAPIEEDAETFNAREGIENELKTIQEKLRVLNG
jgi:hypothetical protein